jgi:hypothetical protein
VETTGVVRCLIDRLAARDFDGAAVLLSDAFILTGPLFAPLDKQRFLAVLQALAAALPDLSLNARVAGVRGDHATVSLHLTGTHTVLLDLSMIGIPPVEPTDVQIVTPEKPVQFTVRHGVITAAHFLSSPRGGIQALVEQMKTELSTRIRE